MCPNKFLIMKPKIFVGIAAGAFAVIVGIIVFSGQGFISDFTDSDLASSNEAQRKVLPLEIELEDILILEVFDYAATLEIKFKVSNPNPKSVILQLIRYELFENDLRVDAGTIGERPSGFLTGSNYFIILNERPTILTDKITLKNSGDNPEFWSALTNNTPNWRVTGDAFFNLSSMTSGGENEISFEFSK